MAVDAKHRQAPSKPPIWDDPRYRGWFFQFLVIGGIFLFGFYIVNNVLNNMASRGIASGFSFLGKTAMFSIGQTLIEYSESDTYARAFLVALLNTLLVSAIGIALASVLGFVVGIARLSNNWLVARMAAVYIETLRNIPLLLQLFFWYFAVLRALPSPRNAFSFFGSGFLSIRGLTFPRPIFEAGSWLIFAAFLAAIAGSVVMVVWAKRRRERSGEQFHTIYYSLAILAGLPLLAALVTGFPISFDYPVLKGFNFKGGVTVIPELVSLTFALSLYTATFIAEIVRAGIQSVSHGQTEAALSLGLKPGVSLRLVIVPQALRVIIPPLTSQYLNLTKNSSLAAAIAYPDLVTVFAGTTLMQTGQAVEIIAITMAVYLVISLVISGLMNWYNRVMTLEDR